MIGTRPARVKAPVDGLTPLVYAFGRKPMSWLRTFVLVCIGVLVLEFAALVLAVLFLDLGLTSQGIAALFLGSLLTTAAAMLLMGLVFASSRSGHDERVDPRRTDGQSRDGSSGTE